LTRDVAGFFGASSQPVTDRHAINIVARHILPPSPPADDTTRERPNGMRTMLVYCTWRSGSQDRGPVGTVAAPARTGR
jgi:hypothetical protein